MERLTKKNGDGNYHYPKCLERCGGLETPEKCYECDFDYAVRKKLGEYEELENRLNKVYGDCDGLLSRVVEILEKHPCIDIPNNTSKSRLLTDEDVDKLDEYNRLEENGRLIELPCKIGDDVWFVPSQTNYKLNILNHHREENKICHQKVARITFSRNGWYLECNKDLEYANDHILIDKMYKETWFLTKSEAEAKLKELRGNQNEM